MPVVWLELVMLQQMSLKAPQACCFPASLCVYMFGHAASGQRCLLSSGSWHSTSSWDNILEQTGNSMSF